MRTEDEITRAERHDHLRAGERGERLRLLTNTIVFALEGEGMSGRHLYAARRVIFHILADDLYRNLAIDIPEDL